MKGLSWVRDITLLITLPVLLILYMLNHKKIKKNHRKKTGKR
ncbi:MAG: hypothetical protein ABSG94_03665 [Brevinematales bacterium]|jgi:hypothetical protein